MWQLILILTVQGALSDEFFSSTFSVVDQCINVCKDKQLPHLELENYEQVVCQRGCRFFNIIHFQNEINYNVTKKECHLSCNESYLVPKENQVCILGCDLMAKKRQSEMSAFLILTEEDSDNIVLAEPDLEVLESDLLADPSIKNQLEIGFNIDYKIPETHIRTMPIEFNEGHEATVIIKNNEYSGDWLDCASRNSGIPRWILLSAILSAVLMALWLSFSTEKKASEIVDIDIPDELLILKNDEKDIEAFNSNNDRVAELIPTKYNVESEKV